MPEAAKPKAGKLPKWAWAAAIVIGLLLGWFLLRRQDSRAAPDDGPGYSGEIAGAQAGQPRVVYVPDEWYGDDGSSGGDGGDVDASGYRSPEGVWRGYKFATKSTPFRVAGSEQGVYVGGTLTRPGEGPDSWYDPWDKLVKLAPGTVFSFTLGGPAYKVPDAAPARDKD